VPAKVQAISAPAPQRTDQLAPGQVEMNGSGSIGGAADPLVPEPVAPFPRVKPLSPQRFAVQFTIDQCTHDDLEYVRALLGHQVPSGDIAQVFSRALKLLRRELERKRFGATDRPRTGRRQKALGKRTIPTHVKREVWTRDQGQCTFVGTNGKRCPARNRLEFDHNVPVARGGQATVEGIRLLCRAHNQFEAEGVFGNGFMHDKREAARRTARDARMARDTQQTREVQRQQEARQAQARAAADEVVPWLRALGLRADESRRAAALTETIAGAPIEERVRLALTCFGPRAYTHTPAATGIGRAPTGSA